MRSLTTIRSQTGSDAGPARVRIWPLTGRTGGPGVSGQPLGGRPRAGRQRRRCAAPVSAPSAALHHGGRPRSVPRSPRGLDHARLRLDRPTSAATSAPAGRRPTRAARGRRRDRPAPRPGSSARHSEGVSHSASRSCSRISSKRRRSSAASSRSSATCRAPSPGTRRRGGWRRELRGELGPELVRASASASSRSSPQLASPTGASIPAATFEAPAPGGSRSSTTTSSPRCAARQAQQGRSRPRRR